MERKYTTVLEGDMLRIIAIKDFSDVKKGNRGGLIDNEDNLSQEGDCWVYRNARVYGNARIYGNAQVYGRARVYDNAHIYDSTQICGNARVCGITTVWDSAKICGNAWVKNARVYREAEICGNVKLQSTTPYNIADSIKNNDDYIRLIINRDVYIISLNSKDILDNEDFSVVEENYLSNIKTIRQLYNSIK